MHIEWLGEKILFNSLLCRSNIKRKNKEMSLCLPGDKFLMKSVVAAGMMAAVGHFLFSIHVYCQF